MSPELVHALLDLVTRTYIAWLTLWKRELGEGNDFTSHWSIMMRGGAMLRDDTPVMLSPAQYDTFVKPYDQRVLDVFGGCIHFCGRGRSLDRLDGREPQPLWRQPIAARLEQHGDRLECHAPPPDRRARPSRGISPAWNANRCYRPSRIP